MRIQGGMTFRSAIDQNKRHIISILKLNEEMFSTDIYQSYAGEKDMRAIRTALNELRKEGKVTTDDKSYMWRGKKWKLCLDAV
ncbi:MAG: hypothetical protein IT265_07180 [Saprospiraceae bacterium]|nr:hypothetical protein [Saprospiraceae bacterium]